jgi:hypothetical protein
MLLEAIRKERQHGCQAEAHPTEFVVADLQSDSRQKDQSEDIGYYANGDGSAGFSERKTHAAPSSCMQRRKNFFTALLLT